MENYVQDDIQQKNINETGVKWRYLVIICLILIVIYGIYLWYTHVGKDCIGTDIECTVIPPNVMDSIKNSLTNFDL